MANKKVYTRYTPIHDMFSYESALNLGFAVNEFGRGKSFIKLAPRLSSAPEQPKQGDKVYDHENSFFVALGIPQNMRLQEMIKMVMLDSSPNGDVPVHSKIRLGVYEVEFCKGEAFENPVENVYQLLVTNTDTKASVAFNFEDTPINLDVNTGKMYPVIFNQNLAIFLEWLSESRKMMYQIHTPPQRAQNNQNNNGQNARTATSGNRFKRPNANNNDSAPAEQGQGYTPSDDDDMPF